MSESRRLRNKAVCEKSEKLRDLILCGNMSKSIIKENNKDCWKETDQKKKVEKKGNDQRKAQQIHAV